MLQATGCRTNRSPVAGFTLVELIIGIMLVGILSIGGFRIIKNAADGWASAVARGDLADGGRVALLRLEKELRDALPRSVRSNGQCLEMVPVLGATQAVSLPIGSAASVALLVPFDSSVSLTSTRLSSAPVSTASIYDSSSGVVSPIATLAAPDISNIVLATFSSPHAFASVSVSGRVFAVAQPVSFCVDGDRLYRYSDYGFVASQPTVGGLPAGLPGRSLLATRIDPVNSAFSVDSGALARNAVVSLALTFTSGATVQPLRHEVHVRNVP